MFAKPVMGGVTSPFGARIVDGRYNFHNGVDFGWLYAHPIKSRRVYSAHPGTVVDAGYSSAPGNYVLVDVGGGFRLRYIHLASIGVRVGQKVGYSTFIGVMGATGTSTRSARTHLHLDLFKGAARVNPEPYLTLPFGYTGPTFTQADTKPVEETIMPKLIKRATETPEWSLFHPSFRGESDLERGYIVTTDPATAVAWARTWADGSGSEKAEPRDVYVGMQAAARLTHAAHVRSVPAALSDSKLTAAVNALTTKLTSIFK